MPDGLYIPGGPGFSGHPQPPDVPCDPTGDAWRGPPGPPGPPGPAGPPGSFGAGEAPVDGFAYGRVNAVWQKVVPLTQLGTGVGQVPVFGNYQGSGFASLSFPTRFIVAKSGATTANDYTVMNVIRSTSHTGGGANVIATALRVNLTINPGVTNQEWALVANATAAANTSLGAAVGGDFQGQRLAGSTVPIWGGIFNVIDQSGLSSSAFPGGVLAGEIDVRASGPDDGSNGGMFGAKGLRIGLQFAIHQQDTSVPLEISHGIWFSSEQLTQCTYSSAIGFCIGTQTHQALDTRGAVSPDANPVAAVRMLHDQIVDFNGGPALNSAPGAYLQYRSGKLYYVVAGVDKWSIDASGNVRAAGTITGSVTP